MKLSIALVLPLTVLALSCSQNADNEKEAAPPAGMIYLDLASYGKDLLLPVPDTANSRLMVEESADGALIVSSGKNFALQIYESPFDLDLAKSDIMADEVNRHQRWVTDSSGTLLWESAITSPQHHLMMNRAVHGRTYGFRERDGEVFNESDVKRMRESVLSAKSHKG